MVFPLKLLKNLTLPSVCLGGAGTCLGVVFATIFPIVNQVGISWASGISHSIAISVQSYFDILFQQIMTPAVLAQSNNMTTPSADARIRGFNWTDVWTPFLLQFSSKFNDTWAIVAMSFVDYNWIYSSTSPFSNIATERTLEWVENLKDLNPPLVTDMTVGGFRYDQMTFRKLNYTAGSNYSSEVLYATASLVRPVLPDIRNFLLSLRKQDRNNPASILFTLQHSWLPNLIPPRYWEGYLIGSITARDGSFLGFISVAIDIQAEVTRMLKTRQRSKHGEAFIIYAANNDGQVIATTRPDPYFYGYWATSYSTVVPSGCYTTALLATSLPRPHIACLLTIKTYPYAPLNALSLAFATTKTFLFDFFDLPDGTTAAIASERFPTLIAGLNWNVVSVIPEEDLYIESLRKSVGLLIGLVVLVAVLAIGLSLAILHVVIKRLDDVQTKMINLAQLGEFDKDDDLNHDEDDHDENGDEKNKSNKNNTNNTTENAGSSWIAEVANLENVFAETVKSMTHFTRYVSRGVVKELIIQRKKAAAQSEAQHEKNNIIVENNEEAEGTVSKTTAAQATNSIHHSHHQDDNNIAQEYDVTILTADIDGFSSQIWNTSRANQDAVLFILQIYFKRMCRLIMGHGGVVDKFLGDSIMSYWGAPVKTEHHALLATLAALSLVRESRRDPLKKIFARSLQREVKLRCGLSSGPAVVGTFGHAECVNYSVIGAPVAQSRHLQDFSQYWNSSILMDGNCMRKLDDVIVHRLICQAQLDPEAPPIYVYQVMGFNADSKLFRSKFKNSDESRTIAFTEVLSLPTINSSNEGVQDILINTSPENETLLDGLLAWHARGRTVLPPSVIAFAEQFAEAAQFFIDMKFSEAIQRLEILRGLTRYLCHQSSNNNSLSSHDQRTSFATSGNDMSTAKTPSDSTATTSTTSGASLMLFDFLDNEKRDTLLEYLIDVATAFAEKKPSRASIHQPTNTFMIKAFKLDALFKGEYNQNNTKNNKSRDGNNKKLKSKKRKLKSNDNARGNEFDRSASSASSSDSSLTNN